MANLSVHPAAEAEFEDALDWYRTRSVHAADRFEASFRQALQSIEANPSLYPPRGPRHRFCTLRRYPYYLIDRVYPDQVRVVAVAHFRRRPGYWSRRV